MVEVNPLFGPLLIGRAACAAEFRSRKSNLDFLDGHEADIEKLSLDGWEVSKLLKNSVRFKREVSFDWRLENAIWCILYNLGYSCMNKGRSFKVQITQHETKPILKQIDVYAEDEQTIVVVECKASENFTKRSLQKDIGEFASLKGQIATAIKLHRPDSAAKRIIWIMATHNVGWSEEDIKRAESQNIQVVREQERRYFSELAHQIGPAGRFQFHSNFLAKTKAMEQIRVPAIKTKLGGQTCYFFSASPNDILPISFVSHRDLKDPATAPSYQRLIKRDRLKAVARYISQGGFFPNALLANFKVEVVFESLAPKNQNSASPGFLILPSGYKSMWIIDGQHRLYGYAENGEGDDHLLPIVAFEQLSAKMETELFKTINSEQKKVSTTLIDQLRGDQDLESPDQKKRLRAIVVRSIEQLKQEQGGPFFQRFKDADLPSPQENQLTISEIANVIVSSGLVGRINPAGGLSFLQGPFWRDTTAATINSFAGGYSKYFEMIAHSNLERWEQGKGGHLCVNVAVQAYTKLFAELIAYMQKDRGLDARAMSEGELIAEVQPYLQPVIDYNKNTNDVDFETLFSIQYGSGAIPAYFFQLAKIVRSVFQNFNPSGLEDFIRETDANRREEADRLVKHLQSKVPEFIVSRLKKEYGDGEDWLRRACKNKDILTGAFKKQIDEEDPGSIESYLDFLDFKKIVEAQENWGYFSEALSIKLDAEKKGLAKYLKWFDEVNRIRRIPAHPYGKSYKDADIELLRFVDQRLRKNGVITD